MEKLILLLSLLVAHCSSIEDDVDYTLPPSRTWIPGEEKDFNCRGTNHGKKLVETEPPLTHYARLRRDFARCRVIFGNLEITHISQEDLADDCDLEESLACRQRRPFWFLSDLEEITGTLLIHNVSLDRIRLPKLAIIWNEENNDPEVLRQEFKSRNIVSGWSVSECLGKRSVLSLGNGSGVYCLGIHRLDKEIGNRKFLKFVGIFGDAWSTPFVKSNALEVSNCSSLEVLSFPSLRYIQAGRVVTSGSERLCYFADNTRKIDFFEILHSYVFDRDNTGEFKCEGKKVKCHKQCTAGRCFGPGPEDCQLVYYQSKYHRHSTKKSCRKNCETGCVLDEEGKEKCVGCPGEFVEGVCRYECSRTSEHTYQLKKYHNHCVSTCPPGTRSMISSGNEAKCVEKCEGKTFWHGYDHENLRECTPTNKPPKSCKPPKETLTFSNLKTISKCEELRGNLIFSSNTDKCEDCSPKALKHLHHLRYVRGHVFLNLTGIYGEAATSLLLNFLEKLEVIEGSELYRDKYAFYVVSDPTLPVAIRLPSLRKIFNGTVKAVNATLATCSQCNSDRQYSSNSLYALDLVASKSCKPEGANNRSLPGLSECKPCTFPYYRTYEFCSTTCPTHNSYYTENRTFTSADGITLVEQLCNRCVEGCRTCNGPTNRDCMECFNYKYQQPDLNSITCLNKCPPTSVQQGDTCVSCSSACGCTTCTGNSSRLGEGGCNFCDYAYMIGNEMTCVKKQLWMSECGDKAKRHNYFIKYGEQLDPTSGRNYTLSLCIRCTAEKPYPNPDLGECTENPTLKQFLSDWYWLITILALVVIAIIGFLVYKVVKRNKFNKYWAAYISLPGFVFDKPPKKIAELVCFEIAKEELDISENIVGHGSFGTVYKGKFKHFKSDKSYGVAIKEILRSDRDRDILEEARIMAGLEHENIVQFVGICISNGRVMIVTLWRPNGSLLNLLRKYKNTLKPLHLLLYCHQIAKAMEYLGEKQIVHCDLAARNVLVYSPVHIEITDFGLAGVLEHGLSNLNQGNTMPILWMAQESLNPLLEKPIFNFKTDVWAFGVTCWEILTFGEEPYSELKLRNIHGMRRRAILYEHLSNDKFLRQPSNCKFELRTTMLGCWLPPKDRPTFRALKYKFERFCKAPYNHVAQTSTQSPDMPLPVDKNPKDPDYFQTDGMLFEKPGGDAVLLRDGSESCFVKENETTSSFIPSDPTDREYLSVIQQESSPMPQIEIVEEECGEVLQRRKTTIL